MFVANFDTISFFSEGFYSSYHVFFIQRKAREFFSPIKQIKQNPFTLQPPINEEFYLKKPIQRKFHLYKPIEWLELGNKLRNDESIIL